MFAAWVANKELPASFIEPFNNALKLGLQNKRNVANQFENKYPNFNINKYFTEYISYELDQQKKLGLEKFLNFLNFKYIF